jgi:polyribonucleotide nucleotidyltransferase
MKSRRFLKQQKQRRQQAKRRPDPRQADVIAPLEVSIRMIPEERRVVICVTRPTDQINLSIEVAEQIRDAMTTTINALKELDNGEGKSGPGASGVDHVSGEPGNAIDETPVSTGAGGRDLPDVGGSAAAGD